MTTSHHFRIPGEGTGTPEIQPDGSLMVRGQRVFRTGTFRDSRGRQTEWTGEDLHNAAANFRRLSVNELPNVPVRKDHTRTVKDVAGYFTDVYVQGQYLLADYSILVPEDVAKFQQGIFRSVSLEIGTYRTNDEVEHTPVVMGLALVDLPAVEGLFTLHQEESAMFTQEQLDWAVASAYAAGIEADRPVDENVINHALALGYAQADLDIRAEFAANNDDLAPFQFTLVDGTQTCEYGAVQAIITEQGLRIAANDTALAEQRTATRHDFVAQLATDGKITAPMVEGLKATVTDMSVEAFEGFAKTYAAAPVLGILAGNGATGKPGDGAQGDTTADKIAHLEMVVQMHRNAGTKDEALHALPSWTELQDLIKTTEV